MKKEYIKPAIKVLSLEARDGFLAVTSDVGPMTGFDNNVGGDEGDGGDYGRDGGSSRPNIWEQGW